ncbi:MAG: hypothetical protein KatS3mg087_1841 [Patescibacteria group bacterium]|nr:MAG: hypothetical protein KatS3mg087_1841 [Patescibacteria group bacterium]
MPMIIILALRWWYSAGWRWAWQRSVNKRVRWCIESFSMTALVRTWFSPFKQTYSKAREGSIDLKVQAAIDNLVSRIVGTLARTIILMAGLVCMIGSVVSGILIVLIWPFIPMMPFIGVLLMVLGVGI